jgi:hypothetical protein
MMAFDSLLTGSMEDTRLSKWKSFVRLDLVPCEVPFSHLSVYDLQTVRVKLWLFTLCVIIASR